MNIVTFGLKHGSYYSTTNIKLAEKRATQKVNTIEEIILTVPKK